jgi:hypothetical protein
MSGKSVQGNNPVLPGKSTKQLGKPFRCLQLSRRHFPTELPKKVPARISYFTGATGYTRAGQRILVDCPTGPITSLPALPLP